MDLIAGHFSGKGRAIGPVCVCLSVSNNNVCNLNQITFHLNILYGVLGHHFDTFWFAFES